MADVRIEPAKCYRTRSGKKVMAAQNGFGEAGPGTVRMSNGVMLWADTGKASRHGSSDPKEVVSEWDEPFAPLPPASAEAS